MALAGLSTLGVQVGYCVETTSGTRPTTSYTELSRINSIGDISIDLEQIDASAMVDTITKNVAGRGSVSDWSITVNVTPATLTEWETLITASQADATLRTWFEITHPSLTDGYFVCAELPSKLPINGLEQNSLMTMEIPLTINEVHGYDTKVAIS